MDSEINEIKVNGVDYVRKDSVPEKKYDGEIKIVILQRGWVYVGRYTQNNETMMCELNQSHCIRKWGTTKGLGEIAGKGPLNDTILDKCYGVVEFDYLTVVAMIAVEESKWASKL